MNKHMLILPLLLVSATALLALSVYGPDDLSVISSNPSATPQPVDSATPPDGSASPGSSQPSAKPSAKPTPKPSPKPSSTPLPSFGIVATTADAVLREAQIQAGRVDPFKSVLPPDLPEFEPAINPEQLALPSLPPLPVTPQTGPAPVILPEETPVPITIETPPPRPPLDQGLVLKGIMDGGVDPIAIIEIRGRTELVRVGERLTGNILVTSIHYEERRVTLSRGDERATLQMPEPKSLPY